jgi:hypothetical protein
VKHGGSKTPGTSTSNSSARSAACQAAGGARYYHRAANVPGTRDAHDSPHPPRVDSPTQRKRASFGRSDARDAGEAFTCGPVAAASSAAGCSASVRHQKRVDCAKMLNAAKLLSHEEIAWDRAITAHANVLYYQRKVDLWTMIDTVTRLVSAFSASAALVGLLGHFGASGTWVTLGFGALSAVGNVVGITLRVPDKVRALGVLLAEYIGHANTFEQLYQFGLTESDLKVALQAFKETEVREAKDHPHPSKKLLAESRDRVHARIGAHPTPAALAQ